MLSIEKDGSGDTINIALSGTIDEQDDFYQLIGRGGKILLIDCAGVTRINSVGIKKWVKYFEEVIKQGVTVTFSNFSTALVEQLNIVKNFACGGHVESILLPYSCTACGHTFQASASCDDLRAQNMTAPNTACEKCKAEAEFDEIPEEYFAFLSRNS